MNEDELLMAAVEQRRLAELCRAPEGIAYHQTNAARLEKLASIERQQKQNTRKS